MTLALAQAALAAPQELATWRALAHHLRARGRLDDALAVCDDAATHLGLEHARALACELGALPPTHAGRAFAHLPPLERLAAHHGGNYLHLRPRPAPAPHPLEWLVPTRHGWLRFAPQAQEPAAPPLPCHDPTGPATWLEDGRILTAAAERLTLHAADRPPTSLPPLDNPVTALLGLSGCGASAAIATARGAVRDVFVMFDPAAPARLLANISAELAAEAAPVAGFGFACIGDGVQASEVRFVRPDGGWATRMVHHAPLRAITAGDALARTLVSLDRDGLVVVWRADSRPCPCDAGELGETFGALGTRPAQALYRHTDGVREAILLHAARNGLVFAALGAEDSTFVPGLTWLPVTTAEPVSSTIPVAASDGWLWLELATRAMPLAAQLSVRLAEEHELRTLPGLSRAACDALLAWRTQPDARPLPAIGEASVRLRCSRPRVEQLARSE